MEEVNEMALTELVTQNLPTINFDYSKIDEETSTIMKNAEVSMQVSAVNTRYVFGEQLCKVQDKLAGNNQYNGYFEEWYSALGLKKSFVYDTINYYKVVCQTNSQKILNLPITKVKELAKLTFDQQKEVIENVPLDELDREQVRELTKKVKEAGQYNEDLLNEIRQKDDKIKTKEAEAQQLQEEKDKKDQEIAELKAKLQEMEENFQPVEKVEPEVVEKIVEVEKVVEVEKEVVPEDIKEELETLRKIAKERNEIPEHIKNELFSLREQVAEKDALLNDAKDTVEAIATATNSKFGTQKVDWNLLGDIVSHFLGGASEYSYMETAYKEESIQKKNYVKTQVDKIEKWVLQMKQMMNESLTIGNVIYSDINYEVKDMEE